MSHIASSLLGMASRATSRSALIGLLLLASLTASSAQDIYVNDGGTIREVQRVYVNDASTIREIQRIYVNDGGVIRLVFQNATYSLPSSASDSGTFGINTIQAGVRMNTTGTWEERATNICGGVCSSGNWVTPTSYAPGSYTIRASWSGTGTLAGPALDTDHALTTLRSWTLNPPSAGTFSGTLTMTLKDGGGATLATSAVVLSVDAA